MYDPSPTITIGTPSPFFAIACPQAPAISYPIHENPNSQSKVFGALIRQFLIVSPGSPPAAVTIVSSGLAYLFTTAMT